ncbi:hypothetical protein CXG81DRAFT_23547 [Caulochytrium protostelioides]|uniref:Rho-GAP domain-containing protein n=1 Tax=Caulochytrium protostelioides TaxID=1555241 RepID=A0A4P9XE89_9FUNG|nr:hypothetical protein CXG81DRAFT_23547 [Caulochytrium protostelioides]|eukprot:RKP03854.1 hypothetical protein CXG81DRAFT_23547 [Caulochytrium protostelioides]
MDRVLASVSSLTGLTISPRGSPTASPTGSPWAPASPTTLAAGPRDRDGAAATAAIDPDEMASGWTDAAAMALTTAPAPPPPVAWDALPPPGSRHFEDVFWGPSPEEPLRGVVTLHRVVQRHLAEARDLLSLIEARAEMETGYSARLMALGRHSGHAGGPLGSGGLYNWQRHLAVAKQSLASAVGADVGVGSAAAPGAADPYHRTGTNSMNDDASSLVPLLRGMREHMVSLAATHRRHADMLQLKVVAPLQGFIERYHATLEHKYQLVTQTWKRYDSQAADVAARRTAYKVCMRQAKEEAHKFRNGGAMHERPKRPPESSLVLLGSRAVGPLELHELSTRLKREVRVQSIMTPLGVFDRCFLGDEAVNFLVHRINANVARAQYKQLLQQMLDRRMISAVVGPGLVFDLNVPYQFGQPVLKTGEPPHVKARKDAIQAELEYKHLLTKAEHDRSMLIAHITDYLLAAQRCETERLAVAHEVLQTFAATTQTHLSEATAMWHGAETLAFLQAPSAAQSVQYIATRWMTGHERPSPILFDEFEKGIHPYTLSVDAFDEEVEPSDHADHADRIDHADHAHDPAAEPSTKPTVPEGAIPPAHPMPPVLRRCFVVLYEQYTSGKMTIDDWLDLPRDLAAVQFLRLECLRDGGAHATLPMLRRHAPAVIAAVVRGLLSELRRPLCGFRHWTPVAIAYRAAGAHDEPDDAIHPAHGAASTAPPPPPSAPPSDAAPLDAIRAMLAKLPLASAHTLRLLMGLLHLVGTPPPPSDPAAGREERPCEPLTRLAHAVAPIVLRAEAPQDPAADLQAVHAVWLVRDLVAHFEALWGPVDAAWYREPTTLAPGVTPPTASWKAAGLVSPAMLTFTRPRSAPGAAAPFSPQDEVAKQTLSNKLRRVVAQPSRPAAASSSPSSVASPSSLPGPPENGTAAGAATCRSPISSPRLTVTAQADTNAGVDTESESESDYVDGQSHHDAFDPEL